MKLRISYVVINILVSLASGKALSQDIFGTSSYSLINSAGFENISFAQRPSFVGQAMIMNSIALSSKLELNWKNTNVLNWKNTDISAVFSPFIRIDPNDTARTHVDLREAKFNFRFGKTELILGNDYVFWGKTESAQIVDIINQVDMLELLGGKKKLGQPMLALHHVFDIGGNSVSASAYYMPYFRERTFLLLQSRLRFETLIDNEATTFKNGASRFTPSFAGRLASTVNNVDLALSAFHGVSRDPAFYQIQESGKAATEYGIISQIGLEGQITGDATLWKLEAIYRDGQLNLIGEKKNYFSTIVGTEHTIYGLGGTNVDIGIILEYAWDSRQKYVFTALQNDIVLGGRITFNDTQDSSILVTTSVDVKTRETLFRSEYKSRLTDNLFLTVEAGGFFNTNSSSIIYNFRNDSYIGTTLTLRW